MSDLLYPIFFIPMRLTGLLMESWLVGGSLGQVLCKLVPFLGEISVLVSVQSLVLIAVDRFGAVVFPLRSPLISSKMCPFVILATWIVAVAVLLPNLFALKLVKDQAGNLHCVSTGWKAAFGESSSIANYFLAICVVFIYVPTVLLVILYSIVVKLKTQKIPGEQSDNAEQQRGKRNSNVLKMAIAIVVGFVLCWVPWCIINLLLLSALESDRTLACGFYLYHRIAFLISLLSIGVRAHSDLGGRRSSCPKKLHNARMCKR